MSSRVGLVGPQRHVRRHFDEVIFGDPSTRPWDVTNTVNFQCKRHYYFDAVAEEEAHGAFQVRSSSANGLMLDDHAESTGPCSLLEGISASWS